MVLFEGDIYGSWVMIMVLFGSVMVVGAIIGLWVMNKGMPLSDRGGGY